MKHLFPFWATLALLLTTTVSRADCNNPRIIRSAQAGNFNATSTWVGGVVPSICDYVVIDHAVTLNVSFSTGQNGNGSVVVNNGGSLSGAQTLTVNNGYSLTNNGTLSINNVQLNNGGATFVNNGTATLGQNQNWDNGSQVINSGVLTVNGTILHYNGRFSNVARLGRLQVSGAVTLAGNTVWNNYGRIVSTSNSTDKALYLQDANATFFNRPTGRLVMNSGGVYLTNGTYFYNENYASVLNYESHDDLQGRMYNTDTLLVRGNMINGNPSFNYAGAYVRVDGNFSQISKANAIMYTDGLVSIGGNFSNDKRVGGGAGGGFAVAGASTNTSNGLVEGAVDFCDPSVSGLNANNRPNIFDSNLNTNQGTNYGVSTLVTRCGYQAQTATLKPDLVVGPAEVCAGSTGNVYTIAAVSGATDYVWSVPTGSSISSGQGSTSITVAAGSTAGVVTVRVVGAGSTYAATSKLLLLSGSTPSQPGSIVGPNTTLCPAGQGYAFTTTPVSGATEYTWTAPAGWVINYGQGTTSITLTSGATAGNVTVTAKNACGTSTTRTLAVTPPAALSATSFTGTPVTSTCTGGQTYNVSSVSGAAGYRWAVAGPNATIDQNNSISPGVYGPSRQINFSGAGSYTITVTPVNACGDGPSTTLTVTVGQSLSTPMFTGGNAGSTGTTKINNVTPCAGNPGYVYIVDSVAYATRYNWNIPSGWTVTSPVLSSPTPTATSFSTTLRRIVLTPGTGSGTLNVTATGPCNTTGQAQLRNNTNLVPQTSPAAPTFTLNPSTYCPATANTYSATMPNGSVTPTWTVPAGWTQLVSTSGTVTTLTATPGANAVDGTIALYVSNNGGCQSPTLTQAVASNSTTPTFSATTATTNPGAVTTGQSYTYQVASTGADTYNWTVPTGWIITSPATGGSQVSTTGTSIVVTAGTGAGSVSVTGTKSGCTSAPASRVVQANQPTSYAAVTYGPAKKLTCYATGQSLMQATDGDGSIVSASVVSGSLPAGVSLNPTTGELTVTDATLITARPAAGAAPQPTGSTSTPALISSTTTFTVRTVDTQGGQTDTPISLTFNSDAAASVNVATPKALQQYADGDVLATYADPDGAITSATLNSGFLPAGTTLTAANGVGQLVVSNASQLTPGTYSFAARCTDGSCLIGVSVVNTTVNIGNSQTLPVELTAFAARRNGRSVLLTWTTAQERDNAYFQVERSLDGREFTALGRVAGQGSSTAAHQYAYPDAAPLAAQSYYRLRQVDRDGTEHFSAIGTVAAVAEAGARLAATAYPNPTPGRLTLRCTGAAPTALRVVVSTPVGQVLQTLALPLNGAAEATLDLAPYPAGVYLLRLQADARQTVLRVTKE